MEEYRGYKNKLSVTWNQDWIGEYESPWSIFEKFKFANHATCEDIFYLFGHQKSKRIVSNKWGYYLRNLFTLEGLEERKMEEMLSLSIKNNNKQNIIDLTNLFIYPRHKESYFFRENLAYCKDCLKIGFHSIFHQFKLLSYCPFHKKELSFECNTCKKAIPYILSDNLSNAPFECSCGYAMFKYTKNYSDTWKKVNKLRLQDSVIKKWLMFNKISSLKVYYPLDLFSSSSNEVLDKTISFMEELNGLINFPHLQPIIETNPNILDINSDIDNYIYQLSKSTFKSLVRNLKRTILLKHKSCIVRYKKMYPDLNSCPYAFAFVNWRKEIEGLNNYWNVENGVHKYNKRFQFYSRPDNELLINIYNNFINSYNTKYSHNQLISLVNRIMVLLSINHFFTWVSIASKFTTENINIHNVPLNYEKFPFLIMKQMDSNQVFDQFILRKLSDKNEDFPILSCPFITKN